MNTIFSTEGGIGAILVVIGTILILCTRFEKYGFTCATTGFILLLPVAAARVIKDACAWNYFIFYTNIIYLVFCVLVNTLPDRKEKKKVKKERTRKIKKRKKRVVKKNR